jgi:tetratricopeptide (TPR) repeat protein
LKDEPINPFKEAEKIELVSKSDGTEPSPAEDSIVRSARPADVAVGGGEPAGGQQGDGTLTPWKKRREPGARNRKKLILFVLAITFLAPIFAVFSAISCVPNGLATVELHTGLALGSRALILDGFKRGWNNSPAQVGTLIQIANMRAAVDRTAAIELYNDCVRINPNFASCYMNRGLNYTYLQQPDLAMADYDKALQLNPHYSLAFNNRACHYQDLGKYSMALKDHDRAVALAPDIAIYYYNRGYTHELMNDHAKALNDYLKCQKLGYKDDRVQMRIDDVRQHLK